MRLSNGRFCTREQLEQEQEELGSGQDNPVNMPTLQTDITKAKMPAWNGVKPELWFRMADLQFKLFTEDATTEEGKLAMATTVIPMEVLDQYETALAGATPYTSLKEAVCGAAKPTNARLFNQFMSNEVVGKPSDYVRQQLSVLQKVKTSKGKPVNDGGGSLGMATKAHDRAEAGRVRGQRHDQ